jgi:hypothetical protein
VPAHDLPRTARAAQLAAPSAVARL